MLVTGGPPAVRAADPLLKIAQTWQRPRHPGPGSTPAVRVKVGIAGNRAGSGISLSTAVACPVRKMKEGV